MRSKIVYLSGQMSGLDGYNFAEFDRYAALLREQGYVVISPAETAGGVDHLPRQWYFRFDFAVIATVDFVFVMPNWTKSAGARAEVIMANEMGIPIFELQHDGQQIGRVQIDETRVGYHIHLGQSDDLAD